MNNISEIHDCYGCGVCATICAKNVISIELNKNGFYEPRITDADLCTQCGLCLDVCAFSHTERSVEPNEVSAYAGWSNNIQVRRKASSGGVGYEIAKSAIEQGYKFCGCRYNVEHGRAEHYIASTVEEAIPSMGSKYIQSYTVDGFKAINRKEKYLVSGTPCQIDSFRRYIKKFRCEENFVLMDFFCHAVPSMWAWKKYTGEIEKEIGKITEISWRNKFTGWHDSWLVSAEGDRFNVGRAPKGAFEERKGDFNAWFTRGDVFYNLFLRDFCCNPACQKSCKYKYNKSAADIRIGDLWGPQYKDNEDGVTGVVAFNEKGKEILKQIDTIQLVDHPFEIVAQGQMKCNAGSAFLAPVARRMLNNKKQYSLKQWKLLLKCEGALHLPTHIINKIKHLTSK